ncbi:hypothetical protein MMC09_006407 [Bachmanniomyces sp. S44760]|nr:hypothetical protein [Bachmanniomyces sp. S44760]
MSRPSSTPSSSAHPHQKSPAELSAASSAATNGALVGGSKYGLATLLLGAAGYAMSPIYRGLTIQFKVFIQLSGMTLGAMLGGERAVRELEIRSRVERKMERDRKVWEGWERELEELEGKGGDAGAGAGMVERTDK